jgi:hypothetical protein
MVAGAQLPNIEMYGSWCYPFGRYGAAKQMKILANQGKLEANRATLNKVLGNQEKFLSNQEKILAKK